MSISIELVQGEVFASQASTILEQAWSTPGIRYTEEYVRWQLGFPYSQALPSVAAFDGNEAVGFAGISARRMRYRSTYLDIVIVSFVAVRPEWRNRGIANELYRKLLGALKESGACILTFGIPNSVGDRTLVNRYREAGYEICPLGLYSNYGFAVRGEPRASEWQACASEDPAALSGIVDTCCAHVSDVIWSAPDEAQFAHYLADPRPRKLILMCLDGAPVGAAWVVRNEVRSVTGTQLVTTVDSLWLPTPDDPSPLPALLRAAASIWADSGGKPTIISAPNVSTFDPEALRRIGLRHTGGQFRGYLCAPNFAARVPGARVTNVEIV